MTVLAVTAAAVFTSCSDPKEQSETNSEGQWSQDAVLRFSAIPDSDTTAQAAKFQPVADYLEKALGIKAEFVPSASYSASVAKFKGGDIQLAWFGGVSGVQAREIEGACAIAAGQKDLKFKSYFIAHKDTGLTYSDTFPKAIANHTFTFGSTGSTSGRVMPSFYVHENTGEWPDSFFKKGEIGFSGAHDKTAYAVQNGTFEVGALSFGQYEKMVKAGTIDPNVCVKIWETPTFADYNFTAHPQLEKSFGEGFTCALQQALIDCKDADALTALDRQELIKVDDALFEGIAAVMKQVGL